MKGKKILVVVDNLLRGGTARVALNLVRDWHSVEVGVVLVTLQSADDDVYDVPEGVRRVALDVEGRFSLPSLLRNNIMPFVRMRRVLRQEAPDVVVAATTMTAVVVAWTRGRNMIVVARADMARLFGGYFKTIFWEILRRLSYWRLDAVVAETAESAEWLHRHIPVKRMVTIANAVPLSLAVGEPRLAVRDVVESGQKILLAAGVLYEVKGFDRLVAAFARVAGRYGDWQLVILGEGELWGALEAQVRALGLGGRVCMPGWAGNMAEWYEAADVFVLSSRFEGFGMVLVEAMAHGCACVSVDCTGPRDVIRDGVDGLLVAQDDEAALVAGLERLMGDEELRGCLGARAVEVRERFAPARIRGMWEGLFAELLGQKRGRV